VTLVTLGKRLLVSLFLFLGLLLVLGSNTLHAANYQTKATQTVSILGEANVGGDKAYVEVLVEVPYGENARAVAEATLKRVYPDVRPLSSDYTLVGLVWDQFLDNIVGNGQVVVNYNNSKSPVTSARDRLLSAMSTWTSVESSNFAFSYGNDTTRCPTLVRECKGPQYFDGNNDVGWVNIAERGVLGVTWFSTTRDEFDMAIDNRDFKWYGGTGLSLAGQIDLETVYLHELGHGAGLGHSSIEGAVMEPYYDGVRRALHQDDINGISSLYPQN